MRVGLCGAHGTGKTTMLGQFQIPKITELARELMKELGDIRDMNDVQKIAFQNIMFGKQVQKERTMEDFISDRTVFDILSYTKAIGNQEELELMEQRVKFHFEHTPYDVIFYFPIEFPLENDGVRYTGEEFQREIDENMVYFLKKFGVEYYTVTGSVEERKAMMTELINCADALK